MPFLKVGISHKTAPLELREALALDEARSRESARELKASGLFRDLVLLSTCNRVEAYAWCADAEKGEARLRDWLESLHPGKAAQVRRSLRVALDDEALWHLMQVAASLDSMVLGEAQILGQVKKAYKEAVEWNTLSSFFHGVFQRVFSAVKEVRSDTELGRHPASVPSVAVSLAERLFGELERHSALVVGAGKMAELCAEHLRSAGVDRLVFCNRSLVKAKELAKRFSCDALALEDLEQGLVNADIAVFSTASTSHLMGAEAAERVMLQRKRRPQIYLDIAVPRNVDPDVRKEEGLYLYDMDALAQMAEEHAELRLESSREARSMLRRRFYEIREWIGAARLGPTLGALTQKVEELRKAEWDKQAPRLKHLSPEDLERVEYLTTALVKKILNTPLHRLKESVKTGHVASHVESLEKLFDLKGEE